MSVRLALLCTAFLFPLAACGSGGGDGGGGGPAPQVSVVDVVVRGSGLGGDKVHMYFDVLLSPALVAEPDVRISPPADIVLMACTGAELLLAQDQAFPGQDRVFIYDDNAIQQPVITPGAEVWIPTPAASTSADVRDLVVHDGDLYVMSSFFASGTNTHLWITHVFRNIATLNVGSTPDATIVHKELITTSLFNAINSIAVDDNVLIATAKDEVHIHLSPKTLSGFEVPDRSLHQGLDLGLSGGSRVALGGGDAYFYWEREIVGFSDAANLVAGQSRLFTLAGPSTVLPIPNGIVEVEARLFSIGQFPFGSPPVVGFDVDAPPSDFLPPDVSIGVPVVGEQRIDGGPGALVCGQVKTGVVSVFENPGSITSGAQPDLYLYDPDIIGLAEIRVARP